MRIAIISDYSARTPPLGYGGSVFYWGLAKTLAERGHEVSLFATEGSLVPPNGRLYPIPSAPRGLISYAAEVKIETEYHDILMEAEIVHSCSLDHIVSERLRHLYNKREIINTLNGRVYCLPRPPFNVVTGSKVWQEDAKSYGLNSEMVYWGVDTSFYTPGTDGRDDYYLWLARFHPDKGLDLALDLAEELGFPLKVAGSMEFLDHEEHGKRYLSRIEGIPNVEYVPLPVGEGHHEAKRELYRRAKAFLYPVNYFECFGMVVVEAMACGCPVITSDKGAMPEIVEQGGFTCKNEAEFRAVINGNMAVRHPQRQAKKFSWEESARGYEKLYYEVANGKEW